MAKRRRTTLRCLHTWRYSELVSIRFAYPRPRHARTRLTSFVPAMRYLVRLRSLTLTSHACNPALERMNTLPYASDVEALRSGSTHPGDLLGTLVGKFISNRCPSVEFLGACGLDMFVGCLCWGARVCARGRIGDGEGCVGVGGLCGEKSRRRRG